MATPQQAVANYLVAKGTSPEQAQALVARLTPSELQQAQQDPQFTAAVLLQRSRAAAPTDPLAGWSGGNPGPVSPPLQAAISGFATALHPSRSMAAPAVPAGSFLGTQPVDQDTIVQWLTGDNLVLANSPNNPILMSRSGSYAIPTSGLTNGTTGGGTTATVSDLAASLGRLNREQIIKLQQQMADAGYMPLDSNGKPVAFQFGTLDKATKLGYQNLMQDALLHPQSSLDELIANGAKTNLLDTPTQRQAKINDAAQSLLASQGVTGQVNLTATADLLTASQNAAAKAIGRDLTAKEKAAFVEAYHGDERTKATSEYEARLARAKEQVTGVSDAQVDQFLTAVTSGDGQGQWIKAPGRNALGMTPDEWARWADRVGLPAGTPDTADNEKLVGREIVSNLFAQHGNWRDVATAWFASVDPHSAWQQGQPGIVGSGPLHNLDDLQRLKNGPDLSLDGKVDVVTRAMRGQTASTAATLASDGSSGANLTFGEAAPSPTAAADQWLQQTNPGEYVGHRAAGAAQEFFSAISTPTVNLQAHN